MDFKKNSVIFRNQFMPNKLFQNNNNNSVQFSVYLRAYSTAQKPITKYAQAKMETTNQTHTHKQSQKTKQGNLVSNKIQYNNTIEFNSLLFMCRVNSYKANYRHGTV
jgi:hypothetical protein